MRISQTGLDLIKTFEGLKLESYKCPAGVWTVGYGHTRTTKPHQRITEQQAETLLREDVAAFERAVEQAVTVDLAQHEFDALVSFAYNVGSGAFAKSTLVRKLNAGDKAGAAREFDRWNKAGGRELPGLARRRAAERALFEGNAGSIDRGGDGALTPQQIQQALNTAIDARLVVDGDIGPLTLAKIREFQQRHRLIVDGVVGPQTESALRRYIE